MLSNEKIVTNEEYKMKRIVVYKFVLQWFTFTECFYILQIMLTVFISDFNSNNMDIIKQFKNMKRGMGGTIMNPNGGNKTIIYLIHMILKLKTG